MSMSPDCNAVKDRKSTRLNSSHSQISYAVFCLKKKSDKREIAMGGAVRVQASAEMFLQSFRENMIRKSNPAILEIGSFGNPPSLDDLQGLTIESRDIEDLRQCVVGN